WVMVILTIIFTLLYSAALMGWLKPLSDSNIAARLEPIIFVIIGYYLGRLPAQQNERALQEEIKRQMRRADAAQHAKEQIQQAREALEEKIKNVKVTLVSSASGAVGQGPLAQADETNAPVRDAALRQAMATALHLLDS